MIVRMWEVTAHPEAHQDLLAWVCDTGVGAIEYEMAHVSSEVLTSPDCRVVVLSRWRSEPRDIPTPPRHYVAGAPRSWDFSTVDR